MKTFRCDACDQLLFFENTVCLNCGHTLGYLPEENTLSALEPAGNDQWTALSPSATAGQLYKMCNNYSQENVCNWMLPADDPHDLCLSCQLNHIIPNLSQPEHRTLWARIENAKRQMVYTLLQLGLPVVGKNDPDEQGIWFDFLAEDQSEGPVTTGHDNGLITLNIGEADDAVREKNRRDLGEPYRTLLGHFRHEIGHYYWDVLVRDDGRLEEFRALFGDEQQDYSESLKRNYEQGAPADWPERFISTYASCHPWEDWAETWAHYLHMTDTLETAESFGLRVKRPEKPGTVAPKAGTPDESGYSFDTMLKHWLPLTYALNSLNRSMGHNDLYPFVLSEKVVEKLKFIHQLIASSSKTDSTAAA